MDLWSKRGAAALLAAWTRLVSYSRVGWGKLGSSCLGPGRVVSSNNSCRGSELCGVSCGYGLRCSYRTVVDMVMVAVMVTAAVTVTAVVTAAITVAVVSVQIVGVAAVLAPQAVDHAALHHGGTVFLQLPRVGRRWR